MIKRILLFAVVLYMYTLYNKHVYTGNVWVGKYNVNNSSASQKEHAINMLQVLESKCALFVDKIDGDTTHDPAFATNIQRLLSNWTGELRELDMYTRRDISKGNTLAYNTNKGESISICLFDNKNVPNKINEMFYVILHELAHVMTDKYEHNNEFHECFEYLVTKAVSYKMYTRMNYKNNPKRFCDTYIDE